MKFGCYLINDYLKVCCNKNENRSDQIKVDTENAKSEESQVGKLNFLDFIIYLSKK